MINLLIVIVFITGALTMGGGIYYALTGEGLKFWKYAGLATIVTLGLVLITAVIHLSH